MQVERLPRFSENMESATVVRPLVQPGDLLEIGTPLFEMLTEKAEFEYTSNVTGRVLAVFVGEKAEIPVGYILIAAGTGDDAALLDSLREENRKLLMSFHPGGMKIKQDAGKASGTPSIKASEASNVRATPAARRLAKENGLDLAAVRRKLSKDGILREEDIRAYLAEEGNR